MQKVILISIRPEYVLFIFKGEKTIELRKMIPEWVLEEIEQGNAVEFHIYTTKSKPYITMQSTTRFTLREDNGYTNVINGKVVASFKVNKINKYTLSNDTDQLYVHDLPEYNISYEELEKTYIDYHELERYGKEKPVYGICISNLKIFDTPRYLSEFYTKDISECVDDMTVCKTVFGLKKAHPNMQTAWREE